MIATIDIFTASEQDAGPDYMSETEVQFLLDLIRESREAKGYEERVTRTSLRRAVSAVNKGAARLDVLEPNWQKRIQVSRLDLANGSLCIMGQVYGDYSTQEVATFLGIRSHPAYEDTWDQEQFDKVAVTHGFCEDDRERNSVTFSHLDVLWVNLLSRRAQTGRKVLLPLVPTRPKTGAAR